MRGKEALIPAAKYHPYWDYASNGGAGHSG